MITAAGPDPKHRTFYASGEKDERYAVRLARGRKPVCNCPDFYFRQSAKRPSGNCKHIAAVKRWLGLRTADFGLIELTLLLSAVEHELVALRHCARQRR